MVEGPVQRRLAAILAADVVGYTRLMGNDEAGTLGRLTGLRRNVLEPLIAGHHGRIVKLMGDGLLIEFSSVVDATACAVAWQARTAEHEAEAANDTRLEFRIGINLGDVIVEGDDIHGDGVNIAARLESLAEPGGICLSGEAYRLARGKVEARFEDMGERKLKNVAEPVRAYRVITARSNAAQQSPTMAAPSLPELPSVAVLPFTELGSDAGGSHFGEGVVADIVTELSRSGVIYVIGRREIQRHDLEGATVQDIGRMLAVRYVLSGTIRRAGERVRATAELLEVRTGRPIWSERYDRTLSDPFAVQEEIARAITGIVEPILHRAEMDRVARNSDKDPRTNELVLRAWRGSDKGNEQGNRDAQRDLEAALRLDPEYSDAHTLLAWTHLYAVMSGWADDPPGALRKALDCAERSLLLNPKDYDALGARGMLLGALGRYDAAAHVVENLAKRHPDHAYAAMYRAGLLRMLGRHEEALGLVRRSMEINPEHDQWAWLNFGLCLFCLERYDESIEALEQFKAQSKFPFIHLFLAAAYAAADRQEDARVEAAFLDGALEKLAATASLWFREPADRERLAGWARRAARAPGALFPSEKPSIAVLPFDNMSADPEQQYFSDGITEDIITELARFRQLFVVARNSSFVFRGNPVEVGAIGQKLGVRYLVEGSVRKGDDRVRITAQLIDTVSGMHIWAERYDRDLKEIFALQEEVARTIASTLAGRVETATISLASRKPTNNLNAYDMYLRARELQERYTVEGIAEARKLLDRAIVADPSFSLAYARLAFVCFEDLYDTGSSQALEKAFELAKRAVALDESESDNHVALGYCYLLKRQYERAETHFQRAISLNSNNSHAVATLGEFYCQIGKPELALECLDRAARLDPYHPDWLYTFRAQALYLLGRYAEAANTVKRVNFAQYWGHALAAACCAVAGEEIEAKFHVAEVLARKPGFTIREFLSITPFKFEADHSRVRDGLEKAGLPK